jgi:hypothetical protein
MKMFSVPRVTMNGGSRNLVTRKPFRAPAARPDDQACEQGSRGGKSVVDGELGHDHGRKDHHGPDREVDACREDDEGLGDGQGADDRDLLGDQGQVFNTQEPLIEEAEDHHRDEKDEGGADGGVAVEDIAYSAERCLAVKEFLGQVGMPGAGRAGGLLLGHGWS